MVRLLPPGVEAGKKAASRTKGTDSSKSASVAEDVSGSEDASGSEDVSGSEDASGAEDVSGAESVSGPEDASGAENPEDSGLSTETKRYDPELLLADGRRAYDYTTAPEGSVFEYADFSAEDLVDAVAGVYQMAHDNNFQYGNSVTLPPCEDGFISCERLIARALWDLGITDQPNGGVLGSRAMASSRSTIPRCSSAGISFVCSFTMKMASRGRSGTILF